MSQTRYLQAGPDFWRSIRKSYSSAWESQKERSSATIRWPSGLIQQFEELPANHRIEIEEGAAGFRCEAIRQRARCLRACRRNASSRTVACPGGDLVS